MKKKLPDCLMRSAIKSTKPFYLLHLFESDQTHSAYPTRTVQEIFSRVKHKVGIKKEVGIPSLRHSFAIHLLDKGADIRYIKDLLGILTSRQRSVTFMYQKNNW